MDAQALQKLTAQIRELYGNRGDWSQGGIDRAAELATLLLSRGVTDVSQIGLSNGQATFGDKSIGFAGDYNNDNTYGSKASDQLQDGNRIGWSARGHGNVSYRVGTDAQGNNYLTPEWGSSSDMGKVRDAAKVAAAIAAAAYGLPMLSEAAGGGGLLGSGSLTAGITPASVSAWEAALPGLSAAEGITGAAGLGSLTAGMTPAAVSAFEAGLPATTLGGALSSAAGAGAAGGLLKAALPIAGAVLGGTSGGKTATSTTTKDMDPRLANYVYGADGTGGLLGSASKLFNDQMATGGLNELQRQGIDLQKSWLMNPAYAQGYTNMMNVGQGLLGGGVAGNPFRR